MNAPRPLAPTTPSTPSAVPAGGVGLPARHLHRERDFGIGYGNSSGYASERRYVRNWLQPRFRCA